MTDKRRATPESLKDGVEQKMLDIRSEINSKLRVLDDDGAKDFLKRAREILAEVIGMIAIEGRMILLKQKPYPNSILSLNKELYQDILNYLKKDKGREKSRTRWQMKREKIDMDNISRGMKRIGRSYEKAVDSLEILFRHIEEAKKRPATKEDVFEWIKSGKTDFINGVSKDCISKLIGYLVSQGMPATDLGELFKKPIETKDPEKAALLSKRIDTDEFISLAGGNYTRLAYVLRLLVYLDNVLVGRNKWVIRRYKAVHTQVSNQMKRKRFELTNHHIALAFEYGNFYEITPNDAKYLERYLENIGCLDE